MSQPPKDLESRQSIEASSLSKSQVAQAGGDVHQTYQEIHHHHHGDSRFRGEEVQSVREGVEKILLQQVRGEIDARLATSLHSATFINLDKEKQSSQVERSWDAEVKVGQQKSIALEKNTKIIDVFDQTNISGKLLILGAPGAGKTTTLLELAEELAKRADVQNTNPIPVLLNLSSWKPNKSLDQWLVSELKSKYGVRRKITQGFLDGYQLVPLLDGLDEVDTQWHEDCIHAINQFYEKYRPANIVVCCRRHDYEATQTKLQLNGAVYLNALDKEQIQAYLLSAEHPEIWNSLEADVALMEMAQSPLLLSVLTLARQAISFKQWRGLESNEEKRNYLVSAYVGRMLTRPMSHGFYAAGKEPTSQQTIK
ncbi:MAG: NACHT domain-containing protein [Leptolyngbya sp. SIO3F4]|nr:NACHT domain-containing protein [Leptolyngbya sp. SIO3F4]